MKKTAYYLIMPLLLAFAAFTSLHAQPKLKGTVSVARPAILNRDILKESSLAGLAEPPYGQDGRTTGLSYWVVFSDRADNPVYNSPGSKSVCGTLKWGERLNIAEIRDGYALVYYDPKNDYPRISASAVSKGWISMDCLLLWDKGLSDDIGISQKAVICADLDKKGNLKVNEERILYNSPIGNTGNPLPTDMHFYYILKRSGNRVLLGRNAVINNYGDIYGWVEASSFVPWNSRTCLEPTWEIDDVEYFTKEKIAWKVYPDRARMTGDAPNQSVFTTEARQRKEKTPQYEVEYRYRTMPVAHLRYPIIDGGDAQTYKCTTFGTLGKNEGKKAKDPSIDVTRRAAAEKLAQRKIVNIVIAIDGTSSMKPYFNSVKKVLAEIDKFFTNEKVNVGVMIYRDKEDGEFVTESFPAGGGFTEPRNQNLRKWLDAGGRYGVRSVAPGKTESVFYGLEAAIDQFFPTSKDMSLQSNILLVIGDCGDNGKFGVKRESLVGKLAAQNISMMGFQVTSRDEDEYDSFNEQLTNIMRRSLQKRYDAISTTPQRIVLTPVPNGYEMINDDGNTLFVGLHRFNTVKNKPMPFEELSNSIEDVLGKWKQAIDYLTIFAGNIVDYGMDEASPTDEVEGNQLMMDAVIAMLGGGEQGRLMAERLAKQNALMAFSGFTYKQQDTRDLFKVIVFFPAGELKNLVRSFEQVYQASLNESADRRPYYDAMMSLARTAVAQENIQSTSYYAILAKVFGLENYTPKHGYTLDDIVDPNVVPYKEYRKIVKEMQRSIEALQNVTSVDYPFLLTYVGNNDKYYWLPSEYLPL